MNNRVLTCGIIIRAIGQEGSISDYKAKLEKCFICSTFITCKASQEYLRGIIKQQDDLIAL
jgi:hypothetical protein